jgi:hypothetical protein
MFLESDTIDHIDWVSRQLGYQRKRDVSRSEAMEYLVERHWKFVIKKQAERRHDRKVLRASERRA